MLATPRQTSVFGRRRVHVERQLADVDRRRRDRSSCRRRRRTSRRRTSRARSPIRCRTTCTPSPARRRPDSRWTGRRCRRPTCVRPFLASSASTAALICRSTRSLSCVGALDGDPLVGLERRRSWPACRSCSERPGRTPCPCWRATSSSGRAKQRLHRVLSRVERAVLRRGAKRTPGPAASPNAARPFADPGAITSALPSEISECLRFVRGWPAERNSRITGRRTGSDVAWHVALRSDCSPSRRGRFMERIDRAAPPPAGRRGAADASTRLASERRALAQVGSVSERAPVGHGARGLQRRRQRVGLLHARPGAVARVPLGRGRPGRASPTTQQQLCFALALWNGHDPILKERLFGLTNAEGNHGEDVKEYYFYLDSTPTHSYMKWLYKYPQRAYPVRRAGRRRTASARATSSSTSCSTPASSPTTGTSTSRSSTRKASPEDVLIRITATNRGAEAATLHVLPTLWFRNTWRGAPDVAKPVAARGGRPRRARG